ncbi:hypothetical protein D3C75_509330 [compost metagenome]
MAKFINLFVNAGIFLNISIGGGNVRLWLVIVVVADEIVYRIIREKLLKLTCQLGSQCLVMRNNQRGAI